MKQAKVMLSAIAIFAVVGAAFAFKAHRGELTFYTPDPNNTAICDQTFNTVGVLTTDQNQSSIIATEAQGDACTTLYYEGE